GFHLPRRGNTIAKANKKFQRRHPDIIDIVRRLLRMGPARPPSLSCWPGERSQLRLLQPERKVTKSGRGVEAPPLRRGAARPTLGWCELQRISTMSAAGYVLLADRGVLALHGGDVRPFLQGLISNDVGRVREDRAAYAALLTPQGKFLFDFFIAQEGDRLLLDAEGARLEQLQRRLLMYRLR